MEEKHNRFIPYGVQLYIYTPWLDNNNYVASGGQLHMCLICGMWEFLRHIGTVSNERQCPR